jgi:hypothetical protein
LLHKYVPEPEPVAVKVALNVGVQTYTGALIVTGAGGATTVTVVVA